METIFIYLLKVNGLIAIFYLAYYFLVEKETFFNSNRWFLLSGLFTSVLMPLFFVTKIVFNKKTPQLFKHFSKINTNNTLIPEEIINWNLIILGIYIIISFVFIVFIIYNLISLFKLINNKQIQVYKPFALVDIHENISPFSFFKYIVFNSTLYSKIELESILNHEKVHSREKHSVDVLVAKVFCAIFWFNPFIWWYKKAMLQNLEYIADKKAIQNIEDKKAYQMTLLRVVTDHNCLPITNNFYQSLIKKRIVMLNKNQSKQKNLWKYAVVIPVLVAFVAFFQIKVTAQEKLVKLPNGTMVSETTMQVTEITIDKNSSDSEIKKDCDALKKDFNVDLNVTNIKRNTKNEITNISIIANDNKGSKSTHDVDSDKAITPFTFSIKRDLKGKGQFGFYDNNVAPEVSYSESNMPQPPTPPMPPTNPFGNKMPTVPTPPPFPATPNIKAPKDPNDKVGWKKYEAEMDKFANAWSSTEMKKYEAEMEEYGKKMEALQPDMTEFDKQMKEFDTKMEAYQDKIDDYQEKIRDEADNKREGARDAKKRK